MGTGRDDLGDLREVQVHRLSVAGRQDQGCTLALFRTDRTEDVGGSGALVPRRAGAGSTALIAAIGKAETFEHGRDLAAWLGLVPRQSTTGGKPRLMRISKRGNK